MDPQMGFGFICALLGLWWVYRVEWLTPHDPTAAERRRRGARRFLEQRYCIPAPRVDRIARGEPKHYARTQSWDVGQGRVRYS